MTENLFDKITEELADFDYVQYVADRLGLDTATSDDGRIMVCDPGWTADDGNCGVEYPHAGSAREAARDYVDGGDWGDDRSRTDWVDIYTWRTGCTIERDEETGQFCIEPAVTDSEMHTIEIEPIEPDCADGLEHDWQTPYEILGGLEDNPGVWGSGGGVIMHSVCMNCGCGRTIDTWAQRRDTGEQGLTSTQYEPGKYSAEIEAMAETGDGAD